MGKSKSDKTAASTKSVENSDKTVASTKSAENNGKTENSKKEENTMADEQKKENEKTGETTSEETVVKEVPQEELDRVIRHHVYTSMAVGLVPLPIVDFLGVAGIQLNLIRKLAKMYDVKFSKGTVKNILASLIGGAVPMAISPPLAASFVKSVPLVGQSVGTVTMPIVSGASTYAIGKVFIRHFASGGTFLTFDTEKVKDYYQTMFKEGEKVAEESKS